MDVKSFYTNIPSSKAIAAAKRALDKKSNVGTKFITTFFSVDTNTEQFRF